VYVSGQFKNLTGKSGEGEVSQTTNSVGATSTRRQGLEDAVKRVVLLTLKSPRFLYLGLDDAKPDEFEIAARLSYCLWDSLPDPGLRKLAAERKLHSREEVAAQAQRLLNDPRCHAKMLAFFHHWLQMDRVENL